MILMRLNRHIYLRIGAMTLLYGCSHNQPSQRVSPSEPTHEAAEAVTHDGWAPSPSSSITQYLIQDSSTISTSSDSTRTVVIQTSTNLSLSLISAGNYFTLTGRVDSVSSNPPSRKNSGSNNKNSVQEFQATMSKDGRISMVRERNPSTCSGGIDPVTTRLFELGLSYSPTEMRVGDRWTDTASTIICRGKTSLTQQTVRQYQLVDFEKWQNTDAVRISRTTSSTFSSISAANKNQLTTTGSGSSSTVIHADRITGKLLNSDGHSQSTLSVTTSRGVYPFTQNVVTHIQTQ